MPEPPPGASIDDEATPVEDEPGTGAPGRTAAGVQADDWLDRICPYLLSADGTYRSSQPDAGHRCTAQDPPATLPLAFQERFCLSERHVRCEMFKYAQSARSAVLDQQGIPAEQLRSARFRPSVRSVPLALGPSSGGPASSSSGSRRPVILAAIGIVVLAILVLLVVLAISGTGRPGPGPDASPSSAALASATPEPTATPLPTPDASSVPTALATSSVLAGGGALIEYEVQEDEALIAIAQKFGTSRRAILLANPEIADQRPYTQPGDIIIVPVSADMDPADIEAVPGFQGFVE
jgi:hypothetical protein